jgi:hypothetical protein
MIKFRTHLKENTLLRYEDRSINPLNAELNPIRNLLALVGARHIVHVSRIRVNAVPGNNIFLF